MSYEFRDARPTDIDASSLLDELSEQLHSRFGGDGRLSFSDWDDREPANIFLLAYRGVPVGCGAVKRVDEETGEIKRMFARSARVGIGSALLLELEKRARLIGYRRLWVETRLGNVEARLFYESKGYGARANYGRYVGRVDCVCFEKDLWS